MSAFGAFGHKIRALSAVTALAALLAAGCQSLPEGAAPPALKITSVTLDNSDKNNPHFNVRYTLRHDSAQPLHLQRVRSEVFLNGILAANLDFRVKKQDAAVDPQKTHDLTLNVPVNRSNGAAYDSLRNNPLLIMQGSCALHLIFTEDAGGGSFNPSDSYAGYIGTEYDRHK